MCFRAWTQVILEYTLSYDNKTPWLDSSRIVDGIALGWPRVRHSDWVTQRCFSRLVSVPVSLLPGPSGLSRHSNQTEAHMACHA